MWVQVAAVFWVCGIGVFSSSSGKFMGFGFFLDSDCALISGSRIS